MADIIVTEVPLVGIGSEDRNATYTLDTETTGVKATYWVGQYTSGVGVTAIADSASSTDIEITSDDRSMIVADTATWAVATGLNAIGTTSVVIGVFIPITGIRVNVKSGLAGTITVGLRMAAGESADHTIPTTVGNQIIFDDGKLSVKAPTQGGVTTFSRADTVTDQIATLPDYSGVILEVDGTTKLLSSVVTFPQGTVTPGSEPFKLIDQGTNIVPGNAVGAIQMTKKMLWVNGDLPGPLTQLVWASGTRKQIQNTAVATSFFGTALANSTNSLPADYFKVMTMLEGKWLGTMTTKASGSGLFSIEFYLGSQVVASSYSLPLVDNITAGRIQINLSLMVRTVSATTGQLYATGDVTILDTAGVVAYQQIAVDDGVLVNLDTKSAQVLDGKITFSVADNTNLIRMEQGRILRLS